tara:strand:- start:959 stop:1771 length:813 start_codon:yes stop_codon:yes gene_type:complete
MEWMKKLEDDRRIRDLNAIPKSHDSGAVHPYKCIELLPWQWAKCQNKSITSQLNVGIRAFDLRFRKLKDGKINIPHGFLSNYTLRGVLIEINKFLKEHPSEIVFLFFKREWKSRDKWNEKDTRDVWKEINKYKTIEEDININTKIKDLRGKIVPLPEYFIFNHLCKGKLNAYDNIIVNNSWCLKSLCSVTSNIKNFLLECKEDEEYKILEIQLNYVAFYGVIPPRIASFFTNLWFRNNVKKIKQWNEKPGFIGIDFAGKKTCKAIYQMNF